MATQHYDLEEQEQMARLKAFWAKWGTPLSAMAAALALSYAGWTGWSAWQNTKAQEAAALYATFDQALQADQPERWQRVLQDMTDVANRATLTELARLSGAQRVAQADPAQAQQYLEQASANGPTTELQALAKLRLASLQIAQGQAQAGLDTLQWDWPEAFAGLVADRRGDALQALSRRDEAVQAYQLALDKLSVEQPYRQLVIVKLQALGASPKQGS